MQLLRSLAAILLCGLTLSAPAPHKTDSPSIRTLGTLQALKYNNLGPENNGTAAVLIHDKLTYNQAQTRCAAIGETLYPLPEALQPNRSELAHQLDYLVFAHDLQRTDSLWMAGPQDHSAQKDKGCLVYSQVHKNVTSIPCDAKLIALCTSTIPPTTDQNRAAVPSSKISIDSGDYILTGYRDVRSFRFLGVPFADPPLKDLRFAPPQPYSGPRKIDATKVAPSCIQSQSGVGVEDDDTISEDCLYLNVYTPILPAQDPQNATRPRPVAVYFYGGAFTKGSSFLIDYDGGNFASRNDVVVVTVNYRIGALGWLTTGNLTTGSYGTRDQILALRWVNKHIASFGGDPSHVTIFGQSAGGQSVVALLSSTAAKGLFSSTIVQSAPVDLPWFTRQMYSEVIAPQVGKAVGCEDYDSENDFLSCLRSVPATDYLDNSTSFEKAMDKSSEDIAHDYLHVSKLLASIEPLMPVVDETGSGVIDDQFHRLIANRSLPNRVPTMFTTVTDEASLYVAREVPNLGTTQAGLDLLYSLAYPSDLAHKLIERDVFPLDRSDSDGIRNIGAGALTHSEWSCPQAYLLDLASNTTTTTQEGRETATNKLFPHLYVVEIGSGHVSSKIDTPEICSPNNDYNATCHSADVLPVWGTLNSKTQHVDPYYSDNDIWNSQLLDDVFAAFFRTYNPNPDARMLELRGPAYKHSHEVFGKMGYRIDEYESGSKNVSVLETTPGLTRNPRKTEKCAVFEEYGFTFEHAEV